ncbi:MarR family transcriptional regulator [Niveispirillum sp.]|uniref:MarR family winged helix-turn-helix transcriptional regulator n=1 Tax=Niveispirillum sp. TaxID=1917217 RepID=UPI001B49275B|nr:MarR family transcriptional regulator [Niveispirillum sp.]MBP7336073.1 MarR family transcriptional regulator [Niveispirillum sp.]
MDYVKAKAGAAIGARLRRLSERIDGEATQAYAAQGVVFEQRWFGVLNQLALNGPMSVGELAQALRITHVSVSQARLSLEKAGMIQQEPDAADARRRLLSLSGAGRELVTRLGPLWAAFEQASMELDREAGGLVEMLDRLEAALDRRSLFHRVTAICGEGRS